MITVSLPNLFSDYKRSTSSKAETKNHTMVGQKYFRGEENERLGGKNTLNIIK